MSKDAVNIEETVTEARETFSLRERLMNRPQRTGEVTVFTDEVLGRKHQELSLQLEAARLVSDDSDESNERIAEIEKELREVATEVYKTGLTFSLRAVPEIVVKDVRRKTRKNLNIKGKIPEDRLEEFNDAFTAGIFSKAIEGFRDHESDAKVDTFTYQDARDLADYLPKSEWEKVDRAVGDIQFSNSISEAVTEDADF